MKAEEVDRLLAWWHSLPVAQMVLDGNFQAFLDELWTVYPAERIAGVFESERGALSAAWKRTQRALPEDGAASFKKQKSVRPHGLKRRKARRGKSANESKNLPMDVGLPWHIVRAKAENLIRSRNVAKALDGLQQAQQANRWLAARLLDGLLNAEFDDLTYQEWGTALRAGALARFPGKSLERFIKARRKPSASAATKIGSFATRMLAIISDESVADEPPAPASQQHGLAHRPAIGQASNTKQAKDKDYLSLAEIEERHGIKKSTLRSAVHRGELKCHRFTPGRTAKIEIHVADLDDYLRNTAGKRQRAVPPRHLR